MRRTINGTIFSPPCIYVINVTNGQAEKQYVYSALHNMHRTAKIQTQMLKFVAFWP